MESLPAGKAVVINVATPAVSVPVPSDVVLLRKVTVPVGEPPLTAATVAVSVTLDP
jgi:hypothetical protein